MSIMLVSLTSECPERLSSAERRGPILVDRLQLRPVLSGYITSYQVSGWRGFAAASSPCRLHSRHQTYRCDSANRRFRPEAELTPSDRLIVRRGRAHLLSKDTTINTFAEDLVQIIQSEELSNVILVGHSFGGVPISGAAGPRPTPTPAC